MKNLSTKLKNKSLCSTELHTIFETIMEMPYEKRIKKENEFMATILQLVDQKGINKEQARKYRKEFRDENYNIKNKLTFYPQVKSSSYMEVLT